jgi:AcrR family transcriptional regulator
MAQQNRSLANKEIVLNEAINLLKNVQEHEFRIADIYENTGVSSSVIYSYFRSREGLIDAAYLKMYEILCVISQETLTGYFQIPTTEDSSTIYSVPIDHLESQMYESRMQNRRLRLKITARIVTSKKFANSCREIHSNHISKLVSTFEELKRNNKISNGMSSDQLAMVYESFSYSWPLFEVIYQEDQTMTFAKMFETIVIKMS